MSVIGKVERVSNTEEGAVLMLKLSACIEHLLWVKWASQGTRLISLIPHSDLLREVHSLSFPPR